MFIIFVIYIFQGLSFFVSGGAGDIGKALVKRVINNGGKVAVFDLPKKLEESFDIKSKNILLVPGDMVSESDVKNSLQEAKRHFGQINGCVVCSGYNKAFELVNFNSQTCYELKVVSDIIEVSFIA